MTEQQKQFPILWGCDKESQRLMKEGPKHVPWKLVASHEKQAQANHGQSLKQLAGRGGLSPVELLAVVNDLSWNAASKRWTEAEAVIVIRSLVTDLNGNYSLEVLTPCPCGKSNLSRAWRSANSIRIECMACGKKGPLSDEGTMAEAKIKAHQLWNQQFKASEP